MSSKVHFITCLFSQHNILSCAPIPIHLVNLLLFLLEQKFRNLFSSFLTTKSLIQRTSQRNEKETQQENNMNIFCQFRVNIISWEGCLGVTWNFIIIPHMFCPRVLFILFFLCLWYKIYIFIFKDSSFWPDSLCFFCALFFFCVHIDKIRFSLITIADWVLKRHIKKNRNQVVT